MTTSPPLWIQVCPGAVAAARDLQFNTNTGSGPSGISSKQVMSTGRSTYLNEGFSGTFSAREKELEVIAANANASCAKHMRYGVFEFCIKTFKKSEAGFYPRPRWIVKRFQIIGVFSVVVVSS